MAPSILTDDSNVLATPVWKLSNFNIKHYVSYLRKLVTVKTCCRVSQNYCPNHQLKAHSHTPQRSADSTVDCINEEMLSVETQLSIVESVLVWTSLKAKPVLQHLSQIKAPRICKHWWRGIVRPPLSRSGCQQHRDDQSSTLMLQLPQHYCCNNIIVFLSH